MAEPTKKSEGIEEFLKSLLVIDRRTGIRQNICVICLGNADKFRDEISEKEYTISGMCQNCQDETFGSGK